MHERTFLAVKPDGVQRRLVGEIVRRFERKGFKLVALKLVQVSAGVPSRGERGGVYGRGAGPRGPESPEHAACLPTSPGFGGAAAGTLCRAARAPLLRAPGQVHGLRAGGGHGECRRAGRWAGRSPGADLRPCRQVWQGLDVVRASRALIGATNPADAVPGTIRGDFCIEVGK